MSEQQFPHREVWQILMEECGANTDWQNFDYHFPDCREFRFIGSLGFGGKIWAIGTKYHDRMIVDCYPENLNSMRSDMIDAANERLEELSRRLTAKDVTP